MFRPMKPETIARRHAEQIAEDSRRRELFLATYAQARTEHKLPEPPQVGSHYSATLPDGREIIISVDRLMVF